MTTKIITPSDFLTDAQIAQAVKLYEAHGTDAVGKIQSQGIEPNTDAINKKIGQENDARYLAYAVVYVCSEASEGR